MNLKELVNNEKNWNKDHVIICLGFAVGEVLPVKDPIPEQTRILEYLQQNIARVILLEDACELRPFLDSGSMPDSAEVVGAMFHSCVYQSAMLLLAKDIPTSINPALTLSHVRLINYKSEQIDLVKRKDWLCEAISKAGYTVLLENEYINCLPNTKSKNL